MILRPYKDVDANEISKWIVDEKAFYQWSAQTMGEAPLTAQKLIEHYNKKKDDTNFYVFCACNDEGKLVGQLIMRFLGDDRETVRLVYIIVDTSIRGKGYGKQMLELAKTYAKQCLKAKRVTLGVFENNPAALHCYEASGFVRDGKISTYTIKGEEWKCIEMVSEL